MSNPHRQFGAGCTGCDWISEDITLSLGEDHRRHVESISVTPHVKSGEA